MTKLKYTEPLDTTLKYHTKPLNMEWRKIRTLQSFSSKSSLPEGNGSPDFRTRETSEYIMTATDLPKYIEIGLEFS